MNAHLTGSFVRAVLRFVAAATLCLIVPYTMPPNALAVTRPARVAGARAETGETARLLQTMLVDYRRYAETLWHDAPAQDGGASVGYWGSGKGDGGNEGIRALANTALVYALLARNGDRTFDTLDRVDPALRYAAAIHVTGDRKGTDGKPWGNSWQSAMWAGNLGMAAFLAKDRLSRETRANVERVVAYEADRFITIPPPTMEPGDTKAEENAWDLMAASSALLLMPNHPHARQWHEVVLRYGFNTLSVLADKQNKQIADGKPVSEWVSTTQCFPDYTLENHGVFHPVYAMVAPVTLAQAAVAYRLANRPVPDALKWNTLKGWNALKNIALPDGEWLYPQGLDWDLHDYEHIHYWTMLATLYHDKAATELEARTAKFARARQKQNGNGAFVGPSGSLGFAREAVQAERVAFALLMHEQFGEPAAKPGALQKMLRDLPPVRPFEYAGFVVHRTERGLISFSWKNHLMGLVAPNPAKYPDAPYVTTPNTESLVGRVVLENQSPGDTGKFTVNGHALWHDKNGFACVVDATVNNGKLRQNIAAASVAPGILAYVDRVVALADVRVFEARGLVVAIENDPVSGNTRKLIWPETLKSPRILSGDKASDNYMAGWWANVDGKLGIVSRKDYDVSFLRSAFLYRVVEKPNRAGAREDFLIGAFGAEAIPRAVSPGGLVAQRAGLLLPNATPQETARLAAHTTVTHDANGNITFRFTGPDQKNYTLVLNANGSARWQNHELRPAAMQVQGTKEEIPKI